MLTKLLLALRDDAHRVEVVTINGETRPQLGRAQVEDSARRADVYRQWGMPVHSLRETAPATIDEPLPQRTQTVLAHQLPATLRQRLRSGPGMPVGSHLGDQLTAETFVNIVALDAEN